MFFSYLEECFDILFMVFYHEFLISKYD